MSQGFVGEIRMFGGNFAPRGWQLCNGQMMAIAQNTALFSILGTTYGGNGQTTFALPDLQGRIPVHAANGVILGERGGETTHTLIASEMAAHSHAPAASSNAATLAAPTGNIW